MYLLNVARTTFFFALKVVRDFSALRASTTSLLVLGGSLEIWKSCGRVWVVTVTHLMNADALSSVDHDGSLLRDSQTLL